jgi:hypothetical protein
MQPDWQDRIGIGNISPNLTVTQFAASEFPQPVVQQNSALCAQYQSDNLSDIYRAFQDNYIRRESQSPSTQQHATDPQQVALHAF